MSAPGDSQCPSRTLGFLLPADRSLSGDGDGFIRRRRRGLQHSVLLSVALIYMYFLVFAS